MSKISESDVSKPCHFECEGTERSKQVSAVAWWTLESQCACCCSAGDWLYLRCGMSGAGVSQLVGCNFDADVKLFLQVTRHPTPHWVVANVAVKSFKFRVATAYAPNGAGFLFFDGWRRSSIVLVSDWNAIFDPRIDKVGLGASRTGWCESSLIDLMARHDLVNRFRLDHSGREMWTWLDSSSSARVGSYLDRVLEELTLFH